VNLIKENKPNEAIKLYANQNFLTEALCLAKAFGDKELFIQVL